MFVLRRSTSCNYQALYIWIDSSGNSAPAVAIYVLELRTCFVSNIAAWELWIYLVTHMERQKTLGKRFVTHMERQCTLIPSTADVLGEAHGASKILKMLCLAVFVSNACDLYISYLFHLGFQPRFHRGSTYASKLPLDYQDCFLDDRFRDGETWKRFQKACLSGSRFSFLNDVPTHAAPYSSGDNTSEQQVQLAQRAPQTPPRLLASPH